MSQPRPHTPAFKLSLDDIFYILFKHKWLIALSAAAGLGAAAAIYLHSPTVYESEAKLLVRYVVDTSAIDQVESRAPVSPSSDSLINAEVEILKSWDLAMDVARALNTSPESQGQSDIAHTANSIRGGLSARPLPETNIISVSYKHPDPELATRMLKELVARYFTKHLEVHRSADAFDFVSQQTDQVRARLSHTEDELKSIKAEAGVTSLKDSTADLNVQIAKTREALQVAETELAEQRARIATVEEHSSALPSETEKENKPKPTPGDLQLYHTLVARLDKLHETHLDLLSKYAHTTVQPQIGGAPLTGERLRVGKTSSNAVKLPYSDREMAYEIARERYRSQNNTGFAYQGNKKNFDTLVDEAAQELIVQRSTKTQEDTASQSLLVKLNHEQIEKLDNQRLDLEQRFPGIASIIVDANGIAVLPKSPEDLASKQRLDLLTENAHLSGVSAKANVLKSRLQELQQQAQQLSTVGPKIEQLERAKEIEEASYKYFQASLEKARVDEALDPTKMPNISVIQSPSTASRTTRDLRKLMLGLVAGGVGFGLALTFLIELVFNRTVKRQVDVETLLSIPAFLSIPYFRRTRFLRLSWRGPRHKSPPWALRHNTDWGIAPWESHHWIRRYCEAIRDRLVLYFELNGMVHKPKLVAIANCSEGAGASTLAAGIAAALSETGDGKVLLVDMNVGRPEIHPFFRGTPSCSLAEALVGDPAPAGENLYLAVATPPGTHEGQIIPKKFYDLVPHLKASDFDYIIFDMPTIGQTSVTLPMARLMDKIVLVVEAEQTGRNFLRRAYAELVACRASVSVILNKARVYTPKCLGAEG